MIFFIGLLVVLLIVVSVIWTMQNAYKSVGLLSKGSNGGTSKSISERQIKKNAKKLFLQFYEQRSLQEMTPLRPMLSDGMFRRVETELAIIQSNWMRQVAADIRIQSVSIVGKEASNGFDSVHIKIKASAHLATLHSVNRYEDAVKEARLGVRTTLVEVWSFVRKATSTSSSGRLGAIEGKCPHCGAALQLSHATQCTHCGVLTNSGEHDWVLTEITSASHWFPSYPRNIRGYQALIQADQGFCRQLAEDIAAYMFYRWIHARVERNMKLLRNVATTRVCNPPKPKKSDNKIIHFKGLYKVTLDSVELTACQFACKDGYDRFHARVNWRCANTKWEESVHSHIVIMSMRRKTAAQSQFGLSYARCPVCQAPLKENDVNQCDYCGCELLANEDRWILEGTNQWK